MNGKKKRSHINSKKAVAIIVHIYIYFPSKIYCICKIVL